MTSTPTETAPRHRWRTIARAVVVLVFLGALLSVLGAQWRDVRPILGSLSLVGVAGSAVAVLAGIFATFLCWRAVLAGLGARPPIAGAMRVFFLGQLGKYVPGSVWPAVAQAELGTAYGVPRRSSAAAFFVFLLTVIGSGLLVAVPSLPLLGGAAYDEYWWTVFVLPLAVVLLLPSVMNRLIALVLRFVRRPPLPVRLPGAAIATAVGWGLLSWIAYGVHVWLLVLATGGGGPGLLLAATGAFAAAWCIGVLLVIAPAGAGAREAALILLLATTLSTPQATVVAVVSRVLFTAGDLVWCLPAVVAARRRRRPG